MPLKNRDHYLAYQRNYMRKHREMLRALIEGAKTRPCADVRGKKRFHVSKSITGYRKRKEVEEEIAKCDVVCANCHAERTYQGRAESGANLRIDDNDRSTN
jgi:hypothetical protein